MPVYLKVWTVAILGAVVLFTVVAPLFYGNAVPLAVASVVALAVVIALRIRERRRIRQRLGSATPD